VEATLRRQSATLGLAQSARLDKNAGWLPVTALLSTDKRNAFPRDFVKFLGYTVYNARKRAGQNEYDLAQAHYTHVKNIPETITNSIASDLRANLPETLIKTPIGGKALMHSHNTFPAMAQKYRTPMWLVPSCQNLEGEDKSTISGNRAAYEDTREKYHAFARDLLQRIDDDGR